MDIQHNDIVPVISHVLNQLVARNDKLPFSQSNATIFHGLKSPGISIQAYLDRIVKYSPCSPECFILALIYVDRVVQQDTRYQINSLNIHRLLITSIMTAVKYYDDCTYNNAYYAKVGGVSLAELNSLEVEFLFTLNFNLDVSLETFEHYYAELLKHAPKSIRSVSNNTYPITQSMDIQPSGTVSTSVAYVSPPTQHPNRKIWDTRVPDDSCQAVY